MVPQVRRDADTLVFEGELDRAASAALWKIARPLLTGVRRIDLLAVSSVDSAGMALLAEVAAQQAEAVEVVGDPGGLADLRAAYRLDGHLGFTG